MMICKVCGFKAKGNRGRSDRSVMTNHHNLKHRVYTHKNNNQTEQIAAAIVDAALKPTDYASGYRAGYMDGITAVERNAANKRVADYVRN